MNNRTKNIFNRAVKALRPSKRIVVYTVLFTFIFQNMLAVCACAMQDIEVEVRHLPGRFSNLKKLKSVEGKLVDADGADGFAKTLPGFEVRIRQLDKAGTPQWETSEQFRKTDSGDLASVASASKRGASRIAAVPKKGGMECSLSTEKIPEFPLSFVLMPDGKVEVINLNESQTRFTIRLSQDVTFSGYKDAYVAAGLKVMAPGLSVEQDFMTVALEAVMTGGPTSTGFKLAKGNEVHGLSRFMAYGSRFDSAGELSVYGGGEAHQSLIATDYFINRETGIIDARSTMDADNWLSILSAHYVNDGKITAERLTETVESAYAQRGEVETSVDHTLGLSGEGHIAGSVKAKHFVLERGALTLDKGGVLDTDTGSMDFDVLSIEGDLRAENRLDLTGRSLLVAESAKLFSRSDQLFSTMAEGLTVAGLVSARLGVQLKSQGRLYHAKTGIMASDGKVELDFSEGNLEGKYSSLSKDSEGTALQLADLIIRSRGAFAYDPERLRAARLLDMTFDALPDLREGIRTSSALQLRVNSGLGTLGLEKPIFAKGGVDLKAPGVGVVFAGEAASFESEKDISVESKSLDLKGRVLSKEGGFTAEIEEALKIRSDIEATRIVLNSASLRFGLTKDLRPLKRVFFPDPLTNLSFPEREVVKRALTRKGVTLGMFKRIDLGKIYKECFSPGKKMRQKRRDFSNALNRLIREARAAEIAEAREDAAWERERHFLMPFVTATSDLGAAKASLVLEADTMDLESARLQSSGAISITNKNTGDFRLPERFKANGYHVDTHGNIIIERPLRVEGEYGLRLTTPKTLRVGRGGHLVEVYTLRGPLELSAHLLDLRWARLFSEQDMALTSKTDIILGTGKLSSKTHHRDGERPVEFYLPNGAYLQTSGSAGFYFGNQMLIDNASVHIIGNMRLGHFDRTSPSVLFKLIAAHLRVDGNAYPHVRKIENTIYDIFRKEYGLEGAYTKAYFDAETSRPSHIRIARDLIADRMPNVRNVSSIVNIIGKIAVAGTVVSPSGFFRNETREIESDSHHQKGGWKNGCYRKTRTATIADIIVGRDAAISADGVIQTGRFRAGGVATFRGSHDFYSENIDPEGRQGGIRLSWPELDSVLYKRNPDPRGPVMIPRAPIRLRYGLPINPQMVFVHPGVYFPRDRPVRQYLSPEALDHVLAMQVGTDIEVSKLSPPALLAYLENNTQTFMEKGHLALPMSRPQSLLMDAEVKETRMVPMNPMTTMSMINPSHVDKPMILWGIQMMDGYPTMMPAFIRRIDTTPTGHTSARRLQLFYGNKIHLVGGTVQGKEALKARAPRLTMQAAYYTTMYQIDEDTHEEGHVPVRASAIAGEGKKLGEFDIKVDETLMAGARARGRGTFHSDRLRAIGAVQTTTRKHVSRESGFSGKRKEEIDSEQKHVRDSFEGELNEEGDDADLTGVHFEGRHKWRYPQIFLRAPQDRRYHMSQTFERGFAVNTSKIRTDDSTTYGPAVTTDGFVRFAADGILVEDPRMRPMNMNSIDLASGNIVRRWVSDRHHSYSDTQYSAGAGLQVGIAIAAGLATGGIGSTWSSAFLAGAAQGASAAAISHLATSAINGQDPFTRDLIQTIALQAVTQGLTQGALHSAYGSVNAEGIRFIPRATTFGGHLGRAAIQTGVSTGVNWAVHGGRGSDILTQAGLSIASATAGSYGASTIGDAYWHGGVGYVGHKVLHAGLGAATGALSSWDNPWVGAASGAAAAMTAEMVMEAAIGSPAELRKAYGNDKPVKLWDAREPSSTLRQRAEWVQGVTRVGIVLGTAYAGGNPYISDATADRAIRNNTMSMLSRMEEVITDESGDMHVVDVADDIYEAGGIALGRLGRTSIPGVGSLIELTQKVPLVTRNLRAALAYSGVGDSGFSYSERIAMHQAAMRVPDISLGQTLDVMLPHTFGELAFDMGIGYGTYGIGKLGHMGWNTWKLSRARHLAHLDRGPYNPRTMLRMLESHYREVHPHTLLRAGERNAHLAGSRHPTTGVPFDARGFPIFDEHVVFETRVTESLRSGISVSHMKEGTRHLRQLIRQGKFNSEKFTVAELEAVLQGKARIPNYTWHHHQEAGRMQLMKRVPHRETGHKGGMNTWGEVNVEK